MKLQNPNLIFFLNRRTDAHTHTDKHKVICPLNFFKFGGIKIADAKKACKIKLTVYSSLVSICPFYYL